MKKLLFVFGLLLFCGCEEDVEQNEVLNSNYSILGGWKVNNYTTISGSGFIDPDSGLEIITDVDTSLYPNEFNEDIYLFFEPNSLTYYYTFFSDDDVNVNYLNYTLSGNELTLYGDHILTINWLSEDSMSWSGFQTPPGNTYEELDTIRLNRMLNTNTYLSRSSIPY